jgi:hypothetical protein
MSNRYLRTTGREGAKQTNYKHYFESSDDEEDDYSESEDEDESKSK